MDHLGQIGFQDADRTGSTIAFERPGSARLLLRMPNTDVNIPEILVHDAFDAAGLSPPKWDVFWCD